MFLKNPPILILDEATSALDNESERIWCRSRWKKLMQGPHHLHHRPPPDHHPQRRQAILVLTDEGIVERGSHRELLEKHGVYAGLYEMYTREA